MNKNFLNIIDLGSSKWRFVVFDKNLKKKYSDTITSAFDNNKAIQNVIKRAEGEIQSHIEDIILIFDCKELITIDISLSKKLNQILKLKNVFNSMLLELKQLVETNYPHLEIIHTITDGFIIDNIKFDEIPNEEKNINNLFIDFKLICFPKKIVDEKKNFFNNLNLRVINIFCASYIKSLSYKRKLCKSKISFLEIGLERTSLILFEKNKLKLIQSIPIGGFHISKDISKIFKININEAEKIKKLFNKSETEFSYDNKEHTDQISMKDILDKNISTDLLKKVILYRIQEIIDLIFLKSNARSLGLNFNDTDLFLIGEGSLIFNKNSFYLNDKFNFKFINIYEETDLDICYAALIFYLNNNEVPKIDNKNKGLFEKFFNFFSK